MSLEYVRRQYSVPAFRGRPIVVDGRPARILSASHQLHVAFTDGLKPRTGYAHPMWHVNYTPESNAQHSCPKGLGCSLIFDGTACSGCGKTPECMTA